MITPRGLQSVQSWARVLSKLNINSARMSWICFSRWEISIISRFLIRVIVELSCRSTMILLIWWDNDKLRIYLESSTAIRFNDIQCLQDRETRSCGQIAQQISTMANYETGESIVRCDRLIISWMVLKQYGLKVSFALYLLLFWWVLMNQSQWSTFPCFKKAKHPGRWFDFGQCRLDS
jgi:hypothetical protein